MHFGIGLHYILVKKCFATRNSLDYLYKKESILLMLLVIFL